jgi:hypothetical protein
MTKDMIERMFAVRRDPESGCEQTSVQHHVRTPPFSVFSVRSAVKNTPETLNATGIMSLDP